MYLSELKYDTENVDCGNGIGVDYGGGPVKIEMKKYAYAVPGDVIDKSKEAVITVNLSDINAVRFISDIGGDYPVGDESDRRRFVSERKRGKSAEFISVLEPYEKDRLIEKIEMEGHNKIAVTLTDGRKQIIEALNMENGKNITVKMSEYLDDNCLRSEISK